MNLRIAYNELHYLYSGILEFDEEEEDDENDEILRELRVKQAELKEICQHNTLATKRLYKLAKEEMGRQELRRKLAASDSEVWGLSKVPFYMFVFNVLLKVFCGSSCDWSIKRAVRIVTSFSLCIVLFI